MRYINEILVTGKEKRGDWIKETGATFTRYIFHHCSKDKNFLQKCSDYGEHFYCITLLK